MVDESSFWYTRGSTFRVNNTGWKRVILLLTEARVRKLDFHSVHTNSNLVLQIHPVNVV